VLTMALTH